MPSLEDPFKSHFAKSIAATCSSREVTFHSSSPKRPQWPSVLAEDVTLTRPVKAQVEQLCLSLPRRCVRGLAARCIYLHGSFVRDRIRSGLRSLGPGEGHLGASKGQVEEAGC